MLFLQTAIAFASCGLSTRASATATAIAMAAMPDCQQTDTASLGLAHCAAEDQALISAPHVELPDLAIPAAQPDGVVRRIGSIVQELPPYHATAGPPPRILFQSFLL